MPPLASKDELTDEQKTLTEFVCKRFEASARIHKDLDPRWDTFYALSRNYKRLQRRHAQANNENDRDSVMQEFQRVWGQDLFVPWIYTVIETVLPAILATDPSIICKPNKPDEETQNACEPVKRLIEQKQRDMAYERVLQEVVRSGLRYGIGVQKLFWDKRYRSGKQIVPNASAPGYKVQNNNGILVYEGPKAEARDIRDFFWDPIGHDLDSCGYVIDRIWRSMEWIEDRVTEGKERRERGERGGWAELDLERIKGLASTTNRGEVWAARYEAAGVSNYQGTEGNELFEIWEYHDRDNVYTILGRELLVQEAENPYFHGDFPFQIYRPTLFEHELVGVGQAEPISHLQYELNMLRGQRRDAATLALNPPFFYARGMLNPKNLTWGAGVFNPVDGPPSEMMYQPRIQDLPNSSVSEEQALKADIERTTGMSEATIGSGGEATATGTQLVQNAANRRIRQMTKNLHVDLLRPATHQMRELLRQNIVKEEQTQTVRVEQTSPSLTTPTGYTFIDCGPAQLNADIDVEPVDGSTEAPNEAQMRADTVQEVDAMVPFMELLDKREYAKTILRKFGHDEPELLLTPPTPSLEEGVTAIGQQMKAAGIPDEQIHAVLEGAHNRLTNPTLSGQEPEPSGASQNGSAPEPEGAAP